jgi:hypothetical protein
MTDKDISLGITGDPTGLNAALASAQTSVKNAVGQMQSSFGSLQAALGKAQVAMAAFAAVLAGGAAFRESVAASVNLSVESAKLGKQLGISATQASVLKMALGDVYVTEEQLSNAAGKITAKLNTNEEAFGKLGVATRDTNGNFRSTMDIMTDVNARLLTFKEGTDRNVEGVKIYGKAWESVAPTLRLTAEAQEEARKKAEELGLVVGEENTAAVEAYRAAMNDAGDVMDGLQKAIGDALLPGLTELANWFASIGPQAVTVMRVAMIGLIAAFEGIRVAVFTVYTAVKAAIQQFVVLFLTFSEVASRALRFDFAGAKAAWQAGMGQITDIGSKAFDDVVASAEAAQLRVTDAMSSAFGKQTAIKPPEGGSASTGGSGDSAAARAAAREAAKAAKDAFDAEIENLKGQEAAARNNYDLKIALAEKEAQRIGEFYGLESKAYAAAQNHIVQLKREAADQIAQIDQIRAQTVQNAALAEVDARESAARLEVELNQATKAELLTQQQAFEAQRYAIREQALQQDLQLAAQSNDDPVKVAQIQAQIQALTLGHQQRLREINGQAMVEQTKTWRHMFDGMQTGMTGAIKGMLAGTQGFTKSVRGLFSQLGGAFDNMVANLVVNWGKAMFQKVVMGKGAAMKTIMIHAKEAAAAAFSSVAAIPIVGPFLAPPAAAAAFAATAAFANFSAEGGFNIPAGVNPVTQLHQEEMVLPAELANAVRDMAGVGGGTGGGAAPIINISAWDARGIEQWAKRPGNAALLADAVRGHARRGFAT